MWSLGWSLLQLMFLRLPPLVAAPGRPEQALPVLFPCYNNSWWLLSSWTRCRPSGVQHGWNIERRTVLVLLSLSEGYWFIPSFIDLHPVGLKGMPKKPMKASESFLSRDKISRVWLQTQSYTKVESHPINFSERGIRQRKERHKENNGRICFY